MWYADITQQWSSGIAAFIFCFVTSKANVSGRQNSTGFIPAEIHETGETVLFANSHLPRSDPGVPDRTSQDKIW